MDICGGFPKLGGACLGGHNMEYRRLGSILSPPIEGNCHA